MQLVHVVESEPILADSNMQIAQSVEPRSANIEEVEREIILQDSDMQLAHLVDHRAVSMEVVEPEILLPALSYGLAGASVSMTEKIAIEMHLNLGIF